MYSFSLQGLQTAFKKQEENRTIWNGNESCFGLEISGGRVTNGGVNIDKTLLNHTNEIENLEEMVKRLNTEFEKLKGNKNTGRGNESCWLDEINTPLCHFMRFKNNEDRELSIDRTLQVQTSKIGNLVELVKRLQTAFKKQEENRTIWNGNESCFGLEISGGRVTNGGVNIDKTLLNHTNEIENLEEMVKRLNTEFEKLKGNKNTGRGNESCWLDEINTPLCHFMRFKNNEDRELSIDRTLQVQTSKIGNLVELVKRSIKDLKAWKENNRARKVNERCLIDTSATLNLYKAKKEIMAKALNVERTCDEQQEEIANLRQLVERLTSERGKQQDKIKACEERLQIMRTQEKKMKMEAVDFKNEILQCKTQINELTIKLTSERGKQQDKIKACEERLQIMRTQEKKMKMEAVDFKNEILQCKTQINELTIKSSRYQTVQTKYKETRMYMKSIEDEKRLRDSQLIVKTEELAKMKQTVIELKAHEEMSIKLSKEKKKLEKEMTNVEKKLKQMTSKVQDASKSIDENKSLHNSIKSLKGQIKDKDEQIRKCKLEYETLQGDLSTHKSDNRKILKIANRSEHRFKQKRTINDRDSFNEESPCAANNENVLGKRAKRMRNIVDDNLNLLQENDEISSQESCSESSDDCSVLGNSELLKMSKNGMVLSNKNKEQKSLTLRKDSKKEINVFNITNCGKFTFKSDITHQSNDMLSDISRTHAIDESNE